MTLLHALRRYYRSYNALQALRCYLQVLDAITGLTTPWLPQVGMAAGRSAGTTASRRAWTPAGSQAG